jgi:hypothetical protein
MYARKYRPYFIDRTYYCINKASEIMYKHNLWLGEENTKIFIIASVPAVIAAIKDNLNEQKDYLKFIE